MYLALRQIIKYLLIKILETIKKNLKSLIN